MKNDLNKFGFFDLVLFNYMFKSMVRNIGLYICLSIYLITIFVVVFIIPYFSGISPNQILLNPIVLSVIVFVISILSTFLGIILFKSPIDDGTELLIVSKPISRLEILITKITIFLISTLLLSILGSIFSLFIFLNENTIPYNNLFIFLGFFVGSLISLSFFGCLSLLICLFAKKLLVFISTCGLAMLFLLGTTLNSLTSTNPIKNMHVDGKEVRSKIWINKTKNDKPHISTLSNLYTTYIEDSYENLESAWNIAKKRSNYYKNTYFDFGAQLSSFFLLIDNITYAEWLMSSMEHFSTPYNIIYKKVNFENALKEKKYTLNIKIKDDIFLNQIVNNEINNIPSLGINDFNALPIAERFFSFNIDLKKYKYEQSETFIYSGDWSDNLWNLTWKEFINEEDKDSADNNKMNLSNVYERFLNHVIKKNNLNKTDSKKFSTLLISIAKSALYKVFESGNVKNDKLENNLNKMDFSKLNLFNLYDISKDIDQNLKMLDLFMNYDSLIIDNIKFKKFIDFLKSETKLNDISKDTKVVDIVNSLKNQGENNQNSIYKKLTNMSNNRLELKVLLNLLSVYYPSSINNQFIFDDFSINNIIRTISNNVLKLKFKDTDTSVPVTFNLPFFIEQFKTNKEFYELSVIPTYDRRILLPIWICIILIIAITSILLYHKRDFA